MTFLFPENRRHGTDGRTDGRVTILNAAFYGGHIIMAYYRTLNDHWSGYGKHWSFKRVGVTELGMTTWLLLSLLTVQIVRGRGFHHPGSIDDRLTLEEELTEWEPGQFPRGKY